MKYKWIVIVVLMYFCTLGIALDSAMMENLPGYAVLSSIEQLNATRCRTEMKQFQDALDQRILWSLKMLDTSGQPSSGYIMGNNYWMGNRPQCESLSQKLRFIYSPKNTKNYSQYRNPADEYPPFELNYFGAHIHHNSPLQYHAARIPEETIFLGLCLPASCTEDEVTTMLTKVVDDRLLFVDRLYSMNLTLLRVSNLRSHPSFHSAKIIVIIIILTALLGIVIAGTLYDFFVVQKELKEYQECPCDQENSKVTGLLDSGEMELKNGVEKKASQDVEIAAMQESKTVSRGKGMLTYFSMYSNLKSIFEVKSHVRSEEIQMIHGLRFFGTMWIILAHNVLYSSNVSDRGQGYAEMGTFGSQLFTNATLAVETYFFLSGFVLTFGYLKSQRKARSFGQYATEFVSYLIKRYIRLTPVHLVTILLVIVIFTYMADTSLVSMSEPVHELCSKNWWTNLLYMNNLIEWKDLCMTWTWYISNDMQFFLLGTILLMLSNSYYYASLSLSVTLVIVVSLYRAYAVYAIEYVPTLDMKFETLTEMYIRPWMRIQPYLLGMGTALILDKINYKLHLSKRVLAICWSLSILCNCSIIFGTSAVIKSLDSSIIYETFYKIGWSLGIAWLMVACATNNGGIINQFLSLPCWLPFSRVSFVAYLIDPVVVLLLDMLRDYSYSGEIVNTISGAIAQFVIIYIVSFVLSAVCEVPAISLFRAYNSSRNKR